MNIEVGMKCKQVKVIEKYGFNYIGTEFEVIDVTDSIIMCKTMGAGYGIQFGIDIDEFSNYFELIQENPIREKYRFEALPYKVNWYIFNGDKSEFKTVDSEDFSLDVIFNGNKTIVILDDGSKGIAKCLSTDKYDMNKGMDIAYTKAIIKYYEKKLENLTK